MFFSSFAQRGTDTTNGLDDISKEDKKEFQKLLDSSSTFYNNGDYTKSLKLNIEILNKAFKLKNSYFIHQGYRYLAYDYLYLNDTILAMDSFKKSENYAKLAKNDTATALTYMDLANVFAAKEDYKKAYTYFDRSINLLDKIKDTVGLVKAHYNVAITSMENDDYNKTYIHILKAKLFIKEETHPSFLINLDNFLGEYYIYKKNYAKADKLLLKSIENAKKDSLLIEIENAYFLYSESLFEQKRFEEAYESFKIYDEYNDVNSEFFSSTETQSLTKKFQYDEYIKDIKAANLNNQLQAEIVKNKTNINIILIIVSTIFLIFLVALYSASIKRKKLVTKLKIKNTEALRAKEESEKLSKAKVKFFSTVSHELRTPLYGVIGLSSVLLEDESLKNHEKDLKLLKFSADYLLALINDVLQINKIDSEKLDEESSLFNLRELIETITSSFEYIRIQNDNHISINIFDDIPELIKGNSVRLSQILMNLIGNACKFTENGNVYINVETISFKDNQSSIKFTIKDTGIGIAKNKQESVFDEFSQVDSHNYQGNGSGLGLPIVKKLLALSKSEINLESELGKGAVFSFTLTFDILEEVVQKIMPKKIDDSILKGIKVLIVEDNRINQIVTQKILEKEEIICSIAENGEEAVSKVQINHFDLILMDINMPVKNGIEAAYEIREFNKTIPIIALTAVEIEEMRNNIYMSGMNDIIVKPYEITRFISCIIKNLSKQNLPI